MDCFPNPQCRCCECQGIHCLMPHPGHSHRQPMYDPPWPWRLGPQLETQDEFNERFQATVERLTKGLTPMSVVRCKMRVTEVLHQKAEDGTTQQERVSLTAVYGPEGSENARWSKWTPAANFTIHINNPEAFGKLSSGHEFYVDFTPVPVAVPASA